MSALHFSYFCILTLINMSDTKFSCFTSLTTRHQILQKPNPLFSSNKGLELPKIHKDFIISQVTCMVDFTDVNKKCLKQITVKRTCNFYQRLNGLKCRGVAVTQGKKRTEIKARVIKRLHHISLSDFCFFSTTNELSQNQGRQFKPFPRVQMTSSLINTQRGIQDWH